MRNIWLVLKHEVKTTIEKKSFWFMTIIFPLFILAVNVGTQVIAQRAFATEGELIPDQNTEGVQVIGIVDPSGIIDSLPPDLPHDLLEMYSSEIEANDALQNGKIDQYYFISPDYLATGQVTLITANFSPFAATFETLIHYVLAYNLVGDQGQAMAVVEPIQSMNQVSLAPQQNGASGNSPLTFFVPFAIMFIFFFLITMSSGFMLQSVANEKENRTVEVLLVSLRPQDLMLGKILGLSLVAILQMTIWFGGAVLVLSRGLNFLEDAPDFALPQGFVIWGVLYFILGYLLYSSLMGAIGALAPSAREGGQFTFLILLPLMIPLWANTAFIQAPDGAVAVFLSLFPLTSPTSMMTRLVAGAVPTWQPLVGLLILAVTTYLAILLAARFFRADTLLSGAALNWRRFRSELRKQPET